MKIIWKSATIVKKIHAKEKLFRRIENKIKNPFTVFICLFVCLFVKCECISLSLCSIIIGLSISLNLERFYFIYTWASRIITVCATTIYEMQWHQKRQELKGKATGKAHNQIYSSVKQFFHHLATWKFNVSHIYFSNAIQTKIVSMSIATFTKTKAYLHSDLDDRISREWKRNASNPMAYFEVRIRWEGMVWLNKNDNYRQNRKSVSRMRLLIPIDIAQRRREKYERIAYTFCPRIKIFTQITSHLLCRINTVNS